MKLSETMSGTVVAVNSEVSSIKVNLKVLCRSVFNLVFICAKIFIIIITVINVYIACMTLFLDSSYEKAQFIHP